MLVLRSDQSFFVRFFLAHRGTTWKEKGGVEMGEMGAIKTYRDLNEPDGWRRSSLRKIRLY